ncbi:MAG: EAL domain-containing protein [Acidobacteriaceae bacterium]
MGRAIVLRVAAQRLVTVATANLAEADILQINALAALANMNASPYPFCSHSELRYFRLILDQQRYPRVGGRIRHGRIVCSTRLGRHNLPRQQLTPRYSIPDGLQVYWNPTPLRLGNQPSLVLRQGASFVVLPATLLNHSLPANTRLGLTLLDPAGQPLNLEPQMPKAIATTGGSWREGGQIYGTRCSARFPQCVTAKVSARDALQMGRSLLITSSALLGLSGALLGFFIAFTCCRQGTCEYDLRKAIRRDSLFLVYQPIVSLEDGRIVAAEALTRWTDRNGVAIPPDVFVPLAEKEGFVGEVTRLALRHIVREMGSLLRSSPGFSVSLNVSAADLADAEFVPMLETTLAHAGILPQSLMLEITETSTADHARTVASIHRLRACGHQVYIDDFGTGYSSLAYLRDLSIDGIKIDRIFTQAVGTGSLAVNLLPQILAIAECLALKVVVEGIETEEQEQYFAAHSRTIRAQGWLYGKPVSSAELLVRLASQQQARQRVDTGIPAPALHAGQAKPLISELGQDPAPSQETAKITGKSSAAHDWKESLS